MSKLHFPNKQARMNALLLIQKSASIKKEASVVDIFKEIYSNFYESVSSQVDTNSPILSVLNFLSVGIITSYSPILGVIFSILGSSFGINFTTVFNAITSKLKPHLSDESSRKNLDDNQDSILKDIVKSSVEPNIKSTDDEIDNTFKQLESESSKIKIDSNFKQIGINKNAAFGAALAQKILPHIGTVFGGGKFGIVGFLVWIVKGVLLGAGIIGATSATASVFGISKKDKQSASNTSSTNPPNSSSSNVNGSNIPEVNSISKVTKHIFNELKLSSNENIIITRPNNAPNNQELGNSDGGQQWMVSGGPLWSTLYNWVFQTYSNASDILKQYNISPEDLQSASKQVANDFMQKTNTHSNASEFRIPREYDNVKDVVDLIVNKAKN